jgi:hypothetical protein
MPLRGGLGLPSEGLLDTAKAVTLPRARERMGGAWAAPVATASTHTLR